jgi:hypothetical protein
MREVSMTAVVVIRGSAQPFEANIIVAAYFILYNIFQSVDVTAVL